MKVSDKYLDRVDKFIFSGVSLKHMAMTEEQKLRTMIVYEAYQIWMSDKQIRPMDICRRISARIYADMLERAKTDPTYRALCEKLKIEPGKARDYNRLANDVQTLDHIIGRFNAPTRNIDKAIVQDASRWLVKEGMKTGNDRAVNNGANMILKMNKNFDEQQEGFDNLADTDINITADVSVVKPDRTNYTDEEKRKFAKKFGLPEREVEELMRNAEGVYEPIMMDEGNEIPDVFIESED